MIRHFRKKRILRKRSMRRYTLMFAIKFLISTFSIQACAQTATNTGWPLLQSTLKQNITSQGLAAVRVLGLIPNAPHAVEVAETASGVTITGEPRTTHQPSS
jgi:hypothetical protein